jgi:hypothetical protein
MLLLTLLSATSVLSSHIPKSCALGSSWVSFSSSSCQSGYTFDSTDCMSVDVSDRDCYGDQFEVLDSGVSLGNTSFPGKPGVCRGPNRDAGLADPHMSSGSFIVSPGSHSITVNRILGPWGRGHIRVIPATCPFGCESRSNGYQQCKSSTEYYECSWGKTMVRPVSPGTDCCNWSAAERVLLVGSGTSCPFPL